MADPKNADVDDDAIVFLSGKEYKALHRKITGAVNQIDVTELANKDLAIAFANYRLFYGISNAVLIAGWIPFEQEFDPLVAPGLE